MVWLTTLDKTLMQDDNIETLQCDWHYYYYYYYYYYTPGSKDPRG